MSEGNVIDFRKANADRLVSEYSYHVRVDQYDNGVAGCVLDRLEREIGHIAKLPWR